MHQNSIKTKESIKLKPKPHTNGKNNLKKMPFLKKNGIFKYKTVF